MEIEVVIAIYILIVFLILSVAAIFIFFLPHLQDGGKEVDKAKSGIKLMLFMIIPLTLGVVMYCHVSKDAATDVTIAEIDKDLASISFDYAGHDITMVIGNDFSQRQYRHIDIDGVRYDLAIGPKDDSGIPTVVTECDLENCPVQ